MTGLAADSKSLTQIEEAFTTLLRVPAMVRVHHLLNRKAGVDLDRPSYIALGVLFRGAPMRIADLAEAVGVDHSTMSRLVNRLLTAGMVLAETSPHDRRALLLDLSDRGREVMTVAMEMRCEGMRQVMADWSTEDRATFARLLSRFAAGVDETLRAAESSQTRTSE